MKLKKQSKAQKRANARNLLFRQIYSYNLCSFISKAKIESAITAEEIECLDKIQDILFSLKQKYFDNSMKLGLHCTNWWGNQIYKTKDGIPIVKLDYGYYTLSDSSDIDSDPCSKLKSDKITIVEKFN